MYRVRTLSMLLLASALSLGGCGVTYVSPLVQEDASDGVRVVPMTGETVLLANRSPYAPQELPSVFSQTAGGGSLRGAGAIPPAPVVPELAPGASLELRIPSPATPGPYRIGTGDVVALATRGSGTFTTESDILSGTLVPGGGRELYTVRDDGAISLPEVGPIEIAGLTLQGAEEALFERLVEAGIDPNFSLEVAEFQSQTITVGGEVGAPTAVPVSLQVPTLEEALTAAGGIQITTPEYASIRLYRSGTLYQIPLETYNQRGDLRQIQLLPGDSIFVDTSYDLDRALAYYEQQISIANLRRSDRTAALSELQTEISIRRAALNEERELFQARTELGEETRDYVYLAGEVARQGRYPLPYGRRATLADALYGSGEGFETQTGNPSQIYVLRATTEPDQPEAVTAWHLDARNAANLTVATQFEMRPNDIVFIEEQPITRWNRAFQQFFPALVNKVSRAVN